MDLVLKKGSAKFERKIGVYFSHKFVKLRPKPRYIVV